MKKFLVILLSSLVSASVFAGTPRSTGQNIVCSGSAVVASPFYTCETVYGLDDHCTDNEAAADFTMNVIQGDVEGGLAGDLHVTNIFDLRTKSKVAKQSSYANALQALIKSIKGHISYNHQLATLSFSSSSGGNSKNAPANFSKGTRGESIYVELRDADKFGFVSQADLMNQIFISCRAGNEFDN